MKRWIAVILCLCLGLLWGCGSQETETPVATVDSFNAVGDEVEGEIEDDFGEAEDDFGDAGNFDDGAFEEDGFDEAGEPEQAPAQTQVG